MFNQLNKLFQLHKTKNHFDPRSRLWLIQYFYYQHSTHDLHDPFNTRLHLFGIRCHWISASPRPRHHLLYQLKTHLFLTTFPWTSYFFEHCCTFVGRVKDVWISFDVLFNVHVECVRVLLHLCSTCPSYWLFVCIHVNVQCHELDLFTGYSAISMRIITTIIIKFCTRLICYSEREAANLVSLASQIFNNQARLASARRLITPDWDSFPAFRSREAKILSKRWPT